MFTTVVPTVMNTDIFKLKLNIIATGCFILLYSYYGTVATLNQFGTVYYTVVYYCTVVYSRYTVLYLLNNLLYRYNRSYYHT